MPSDDENSRRSGILKVIFFILEPTADSPSLPLRLFSLASVVVFTESAASIFPNVGRFLADQRCISAFQFLKDRFSHLVPFGI
jgi:hypothetical protein